MDKIGIYGGSFNPMHLGHLKVLEFVLKEFDFTKILVVPVGKPSHKENSFEPDEDRVKIIELYCKENEKLEVSRVEIDSEKTSYTYTTLLKLMKEYEGVEFYEIIGEDSAEYLHRWKNYSEMIELCKFIVLKRRGSSYEPKHENIYLLDSPYFDISSTEIRKRIEKGESLEGLVSKEVEKYIYEKSLYKEMK